jgi:ubiquinone/menaquinone biosynthesis C-methylase UbiE
MKSASQALLDYHLRVYTGVSPARYDIGSSATPEFLERRDQLHFDQLTSKVSLSPGLRILDVGCGFGGFVKLCRDKGYEAFGTDIDKDKLRIASMLYPNLPAEWLKFGNAREIPFESETFDLVTLFFVLEHIQCLDDMVAEIYRVLKPGGKAYIICPNYCVPYEAHYAVICPTFSKTLSKIWVRILGRDPGFLNFVNFAVRSSVMAKIFNEKGFTFEDLGVREWCSILDAQNIENRSQELVMTIKAIQGLGLKPIFRWMARKGFFTPLVYLLKKP